MHASTRAIIKLFEVDLSRLDILSLSMIPAIINLIIFFYVMLALPKTRTNYTFAVFVFLMSMWQFSDSMMRLSINQICAEIWHRIMGIFALLVIPLGIIFICNFGKWYKTMSNGVFFIFQFLPTLFFIIVYTSGIETHKIEYSETWYWIANPIDAPITNLTYLWVNLQSILMLTMVWVLFFKSREDKIKKKQTLLIAVGISMPFIGGTIAQTILPLMLNMDNIPLTATFFTFFSVFSLISIIKYNLLEYSPKHQWKQIIETMNDGLLILDVNNKIQFANNKLLQMSGYSKQEIIGQTPNLLFNDNIDTLLSANETQQSEMLLINKKSEHLWTLFCSTPYLDESNEKQGSIVICSNINESKRSEARFRALIENAGDIIALTDEYSNIQYVSPSMIKICGYQKSDLLQKPLLDIVHPEEQEAFNELIIDLVSHPNQLFTSITKFKHSNGKTMWLEGKSINLTEDENVHAIVFNLRDISVLKENEVQLQELLDTSNTQNERLQNFAHIVSHNIRSHVVNISGLVNIIESIEEKLERKKLEKMLKESTNKLLETTDNLSEIITIQNNKNIKWKTVNLHDEINSTAQIVYSIEQNISPKIINKVDKSCCINVIPSYLESIVLNLLTNAVKYSKPNLTPEIELYCENKEEYIVLNVKDNGIGIDIELNKEKIFGMYKTFTNNKDSRGLGLFITKNQIESMNGNITVNSELGKGTIFSVSFKKQPVFSN
jgi:PAS domain S-box-containing protein